MSYLVLARKWRPQAFDDVTGQEHVVKTLANAIAQGRVAHALLLCGPRGVGKTTTARLLARALNCEAGPTAEPCGTCQPCVEITQGSSIDVVEIDGASNNSVDNVREIRETVRYLPQRDRYKVFIIDEVHMLSVAAFNALLKTLEEPPPHVKFIFATTDPQRLPDTILSRCQRHNFRRVPDAQMVGRLRTICEREGMKVPDAVLESIADQADGGMRDALSLLDQLISSVGMEVDEQAAHDALGMVDAALVASLADALLDRDGKKVVEAIEAVHDRGIEPKKLCEELAEHLRDLLYFKSVGRAPGGVGEDQAQALAAQAAKAEVPQLAHLFDLVHGAIRELSFAAKPRLALEVALLSAVHLAPSQGLADLAARLEGVAAAIGGGSPPPQQGPGPGGGANAPGPAGMGSRQMRGMAGREVPRQGASQQAPPPQAPPQGGSQPSAMDLIRKVEAMAGQGAPRQQRTRPAPRGQAPLGAEDDEPQGGSSRGGAIDARTAPPAPMRQPERARPPEPIQRQPGGGPPFGGGASPERAVPSAEPFERGGPPLGGGPSPARSAPPAEQRQPGGGPPFGGGAPASAGRQEFASIPPPPDDEPPPHDDGDLPGSFDEAPQRIFPQEASPGGCATGDCGPSETGDDPTLSRDERWRRFLEATREESAVLYPMLAEGRLAWIREGEVALGYADEHAFHRAQIESGDFRRQAEERLSRWFGAPTRLRLDVVGGEAPISVAETERRRREERAVRLRAEAREHPAVRLVQASLGGEILGIDVIEDH